MAYKRNWHGLLKILEIQHLSASGEVIWSDKNLFNVLHAQGEAFLLGVVFAGTALPSNFYFGLDNRVSLSFSHNMTTITGTGQEPSTNGYARVPISTSAFTVSLQDSGHYKADGPIISFSATTGTWGPARNLFLTTQSNNSGSLISSVPLTQQTTLTAGQSINVRMALGLADC